MDKIDAAHVAMPLGALYYEPRRIPQIAEPQMAGERETHYPESVYGLLGGSYADSESD
jgi:hypothetical protein